MTKAELIDLLEPYADDDEVRCVLDYEYEENGIEASLTICDSEDAILDGGEWLEAPVLLLVFSEDKK